MTFQASLTCPVVSKTFPVGTVDPGFTFTVTGTLADGTAFSQSQTGPTEFAVFDLEPGTYTATVTKLGVWSLPSAALIINTPGTVTLSVPDATQAASLG